MRGVSLKAGNLHAASMTICSRKSALDSTCSSGRERRLRLQHDFKFGRAQARRCMSSTFVLNTHKQGCEPQPTMSMASIGEKAIMSVLSANMHPQTNKWTCSKPAHHLVGLDARKVQDVSDQRQQRFAGASDGVDCRGMSSSGCAHLISRQPTAQHTAGACQRRHAAGLLWPLLQLAQPGLAWLKGLPSNSCPTATMPHPSQPSQHLSSTQRLTQVPLRGAQRRVGQQLPHSNHSVERGADFVAHAGQELRFGLCGGRRLRGKAARAAKMSKQLIWVGSGGSCVPGTATWPPWPPPPAGYWGQGSEDEQLSSWFGWSVVAPTGQELRLGLRGGGRLQD